MNWLKKRNTYSTRPYLRVVRQGWHLIRGLFPFTWLSIVLAAVIYYAWFREATAHANQILYAGILVWIFAFIVILVVCIVTAILVFVVTRRTNSELLVETKTETGAYVESEYRVFTPFFMPFVTVEIEMGTSSIRRQETRTPLWASEKLIPFERGRHQTLSRIVTVRDIFGLTEIRFPIVQKASVVVEPAKSKYHITAFQTRTSGDGFSHPEGDPRGELIEMRRYQAGDPLRLVLWKVFARSHKLVVRAPEPAIVEEKDMFIYFVSGGEDEASASLARSFLDGIGLDTSGDMNFAADGAKRLVNNEKEGISDLIDSIGHRNRGGQDLLTVAPLVSQGAMANCFLLVPSKPGNWIDFVKRFIQNYQIRPTFVLSLDPEKMDKHDKQPGKLKRLICKSEVSNQFEQEFNALRDELAAIGTVRIIDVKTGAMTEIAGGTR